MYINNKWIKADNKEQFLDNCYEYDEQKKCIKCNKGYGFKENSRDKYFNLDIELAEYYTKDNDISYYPCSTKFKIVINVFMIILPHRLIAYIAKN